MRSVSDLEVGAALHAEGAGDGGEDGDDEVDDGLDVLFFHCCGGFDGYTILWR